MNYVIIVAGGKGTRMGTDTPKQFLQLDGKPILMHTIDRFCHCNPPLRIVLVLPADQHTHWHDLCRQHRFDADYILVAGGETRFHSVSNGLAAISDDEKGVVGIHDGVRPFVSRNTIRRCFDVATTHSAVVPVTPVVETLRKVGGETVPRDEYRLVQTPQTFDIDTLKRAYRQAYIPAFTDDASVVEKAGVAVTLVEGNRENIKITTPFDLLVGEALCRNGHEEL